MLHSFAWRSLVVLPFAAVASAASAGAPVSVYVPPVPTTAHKVSPNFLGLSIELAYINIYFGNDTSSIPYPIYNYLGAIRANTGTLPVRVRLGGNSMDDATYVPDQQTILEVTNPNANANDIPVNFGPTLWNVMKTVSDTLGGAEYVVGLSLLETNDTRAPNVPLMAGGAQLILGDTLDVFLLGNEPDLYSAHGKRPDLANYTVADYIQNFGAVSDELKNTTAGDIIAKSVIGGPTVCCAWDLATLIQEGYLKSFQDELKYISLQHYPQNNCFGSYEYHLDYYMNHYQTVELAQWQSPGISLAAAAGKPVIMSEFNSASCGGIPTISDTFAVGSLWTLDYALQLASVGYSAAYLHTREAGVSYNVFDPPMPAGQGGPWVTNPTWYALLVTAEVLGGTSAGTRVIDLNVGGSMFDATQGAQAGYAAYDAATGAVARVALINYANGTTMSYALGADVFANATKLGLAGVDASKVTVKYLTGASATEKYDIAWAGQTYKGQATGATAADTSGRPATTTLDCSAGCTVDVPGPALALVIVGTAVAPATTTSIGSTATATGGAAKTSGSAGAANTGTAGASGALPRAGVSAGAAGWAALVVSAVLTAALS